MGVAFQSAACDEKQLFFRGEKRASMAGTLAAAGLLFGAALLTVASCVDPEAYMDAVSIVNTTLSLALPLCSVAIAR